MTLIANTPLTSLSQTTDGVWQGPHCHSRGCRGYGDPSKGIVLLGIAPGEREMVGGRPFMGQSGQFLDALLKFVDLRREDTYATNLLCWWNNSPTPDDIAACGSRLTSELRSAEPRVIVSLGNIVTTRMTGLDLTKQKNVRGSVLWSKEFNAYVITTAHPAGSLRARSMAVAQNIIRDLEKIPLVLGWPRDGSIADVHYQVVYDEPSAQRMLNELPTDTNVVVDIETSSRSTDETETDVFTDKLLRIGFRWQDVDGREHVVVWRPGAWSPALVWPAGIRWEFQFGVYDTMGLWRELGSKLQIAEDLGLKSYACDERTGQHGLKTLAREYQGAGWYDAPLDAAKKKGRMDTLPPEVVDAYNARDVAYTGRTDPILHAKMLREGTDRLYYDLLIPAYNMYRDAQYRGINVDHRRLIELGWETWMPRWIEMEDEMMAAAEDYGFIGKINLNSPQQIAKLFFGILGLEPIKLTPGKKPSTDKEVMDRLDHPFAKRIREFRAIDGIMDYVFAIQNELKLDGLLHPSAQLHTTRTGRRSYKRPAMQTIPEEYTVGAEFAQIAEVFIPHNPKTHGMMKADYEQIEVWMAWLFSQDPVLLQHLLSGDVHSATAEIAFHMSRNDVDPAAWKVKRQGAKKIRFGLQYGEGAEKLSSPPPVGLGSTVREAQEFIDNYWKGYIKYAQWMTNIQRQARTEGEIVTFTGRKMRFPIIMDHKELRQAMNFPIQSTASDHPLLAALELIERLREYNSYFLIDVHDALWIEYDLRYEAQVCALVREVMERPKAPGFPNVPVEIKVGPNILQMTKVPRKGTWELQLAA